MSVSNAATAPMTGRTVLVTGATSGIGWATAAGLAALGARVGIAGRDRRRAETAAHEIRARHPDAVLDVFVADLSAQAEVRRLAAQVRETYRHLDVLVNNAGGFWASRHLTADGLERTFAVNHLAPFLLTNLLLDRLLAGAPARVVTVSSAAHSTGRLDLEDLQGERAYSGGRAYSQSKLANILFSHELARRLDGGGVTANVLHPGATRTHFGAGDQQPLWRIVAPIARPFLRSAEHGARTPIYLASSREVEGVSGTYFVNRRPTASSALSNQVPLAGRLWRVSAELVGLRPRGRA
jgi:retinol dehydrogenase 14